MTTTVQVFGPFTEAQGEVETDLAANAERRWHEITVTIFDAGGASGVAATGVITGQVQKVGADQREDFTETIDLSTDTRAWLPELSSAQKYFFTIAGLNAGYTYQITVNSWEG
jgi:hypothetical protein